MVLLGEVVDALEVMERDFLAMVRRGVRRAVEGEGNARSGLKGRVRADWEGEDVRR
jgi:hypothetical protein